MMNSTINTSQLPPTRKLLYNNSNFFNDPVSPRIVNKRNVKFTGKKPLNIEHKQINFGKRNILNYDKVFFYQANHKFIKVFIPNKTYC